MASDQTCAAADGVDLGSGLDGDGRLPKYTDASIALRAKASALTSGKSGLLSAKAGERGGRAEAVTLAVLHAKLALFGRQ